jgi:ferredoxin
MPSDRLDPSRYAVVLDSDTCVSAGRCVATAPGFFVFDADEIGTIDESGTRPDDVQLLRIARQCPSGAIRLEIDGEPVDT